MLPVGDDSSSNTGCASPTTSTRSGSRRWRRNGNSASRCRVCGIVPLERRTGIQILRMEVMGRADAVEVADRTAEIHVIPRHQQPATAVPKLARSMHTLPAASRYPCRRRTATSHRSRHDEASRHGIEGCVPFAIPRRHGEQRGTGGVGLLAQEVREQLEACDGPVVTRGTIVVCNRMQIVMR